MFWKSHWTPRYIVARLAYMVYDRRNPNAPWLTKSAIDILDSALRPTDRMLEFGSGRSTIWFAERAGHITSVEHNSAWHAKVSQLFKDKGIANVDYRLAEIGVPERPRSDEPYIAVASEFADASFDVILVDGMYRGDCVLAVISKLKPGGLLVIDNIQWFLPSRSISPGALTFDQGPKDPVWSSVLAKIGGWRNFWTTNELSDTAFYLKPCS